MLVKALQVAQQEQQTRGEDEEPDHELCDALEQVAGAALDKGLAHRSGKARPNTYRVLLKVDEQVLADPDAEGRCEVQGAVGISVETAKRICCDAPVMQVHEAAEHHGEAHEDITPPITQQTGRPGWDGMFVVDYDEAVFGLLESEQASSG